MPSRIRLLDRLCQLRSDVSREGLLSFVLCGEVTVDGVLVRNPRELILAHAVVGFTGQRFVSRGGGKLDHAVELWSLPVASRCFLDAGASTGGFTDCLLQRGAATVHAVDVGYNQLDYRLRIDPRVVVHERTNIWALSDLLPVPQAAVADLSFRSLRGLTRHILGLTSERWAVLLIKPQFEWQDAPDSFDGIVPEKELGEMLAGVLKDLAEEGVECRGVAASPVKGRGGNQEFLAFVLDGMAPLELRDGVLGHSHEPDELVRRALCESPGAVN
ncbi:MAG: TlyA family RNA methyltransferase [Spirochaetales bacterium]|nr:MAG: TlyA family RNA methyltransferase [Spirochaetales bacterium]